MRLIKSLLLYITIGSGILALVYLAAEVDRSMNPAFFEQSATSMKLTSTPSVYEVNPSLSDSLRVAPHLKLD